MIGPSATTRNTFRYSADVRIAYEVWGSGPLPVVFLHGFAAALTTWDDIRSLLPLERHRLYFLDLKGFGRSSRPRDGAYRPADQAAVVLAFLAAEGLRGAVLVGHSMGGGIAILTSLEAGSSRQTDLIGGLVLIDSAAYLRRLPPVFRLLRVPLLGWGILHLLPVPLMVRFVLFRIYYSVKSVTPARVARYTAIYHEKESARVLTDTARQLIPGNLAEIVDSYRQIPLPVLILWGENDPIIRVEDGYRLHNDIPGSRLVVIGRCGHNPHEEEPEQTATAIAEFLARFK